LDWKNKEWYDLIEKFAVAQSLMGVKKTLDVKARMFGEKPSINNITIKQLQQVVDKLREIWIEQHKKSKTPINK
jgi:hypothetical protein